MTNGRLAGRCCERVALPVPNDFGSAALLEVLERTASILALGYMAGKRAVRGESLSQVIEGWRTSATQRRE
jgi:hypothetical protein